MHRLGMGLRMAALALAGALLSGCVGDFLGPVSVVARRYPTAEHQAPAKHPDPQAGTAGPG